MSDSEKQRPEQISDEGGRLLEGHYFIDTSADEGGASATAAAAADGGAGEQVAFVAADLQEQMRLSSPATSLADSGGRVSSSSSPSPYPPLLPDAAVLLDLEAEARHVAVEVDQLLRELNGSLHGMTALTAECVQTYRSAVTATCDAVDSTIKSMYQLLAKAEELGQVLKPLPRLAHQIKEIKRLLDLFESHMQKTIG